MKKKDIVKSNRDFESIILNGKKVKNNIFIMYYQQNIEQKTKFGISVGKKIGNAVYRNRYKRKIRAIIDNNKKDCLNGYDYIIILRRSGQNAKYEELNNAFVSLIKYIRKDKTNEEKKSKD